MPGASHTEEFNCTPEELYKILTDYPKYPEFLSEVKNCEVEKADGNRKLVAYDVSLIKTFSYKMWMTETTNSKVEWNLESGDIFKTSVGSWVLQPSGNSGRRFAGYKTVEFSFFKLVVWHIVS